MRIIAGKFKGRKINFISDEKTRPTADIVREALFCKIQFDLSDSVFLDLFSGSGAIGLEALSRGAKEVYFIEKDKKNFEIIKKNIKLLYGEDYENNLKEQGQKIYLINSDFVRFLESNEIKRKNKEKDDKVTIFDFVYLDPPYKSEFYNIALQKLKDNNLITNESLIICEHDMLSFMSLRGAKRRGNLVISEEISEPLQTFASQNCELISQKKYGIKILSYLKLKD